MKIEKGIQQIFVTSKENTKWIPFGTSIDILNKVSHEILCVLADYGQIHWKDGEKL